MAAGSEARPDARASTPETDRLRLATRALRLHLDKLPIDFDEVVPPDRFLAGLAFMLARNRYDCAESMIGSGFGGTVIGAISRSILTEGLRWLWIAGDPDARRRCVLGDLLSERSRVAMLFRPNCPTSTRWLMPVAPVADLAGASREWLDAPTMPDDDALLDELFAEHARSDSSSPGDLTPFVEAAHELLDLAGLRGVAMVLAHAGHGNYLGQRSALTEDGAPGFDLRFDHEALFMHAAAVGAFCVLIGATVAAPDAWPLDVDRIDFLSRSADLTTDVAAAATAIHGLAAKTKLGSRARRSPVAQPATLLYEGAVIENADVESDYADIKERMVVLTSLFDSYVGVVRASPEITTLPPDGYSLHMVLAHGAALSNLETVYATYDQVSAAVMSVFASRGLLEEAARLHWRYSVRGEAELRARAKQYFDESRFRQRKAINFLAGQGMKDAAIRLFDLPPNVITPPGVDEIAKNRVPIPTLASMLRSFSADASEPGWLETAYALLSQVTHGTPLGYLHCLRYLDHGWEPNELSREMLALSLDAATLGSAHTVGFMGVMLNNLSPVAKEHFRKIQSSAAAVHLAAREIHGLDLL